MNVLISCAGKQVELVRWFKKHLPSPSRIVAIDSDSFAPALAVSDMGLIAPRIDSVEYKEWVLDVCENYNIDLVLTLFEPDLVVLESLRGELESLGAKLVGADAKIIEAVTDKYLAGILLTNEGLKYPQTVLLSEFDSNFVSIRYVIKPRRGRGSRGVRIVDDVMEVLTFRQDCQNPDAFVVQEFVQGAQYCFDIVNDLERNYAASLIRKRIKMGLEETAVAITVNNPQIEDIARKLSSLLQHQGSIDVEAIEVDGTAYVIDVNMRFGGSYPFSHAAGSDIPGALVAWARGEVPSEAFLTHTHGVVSSKFNSVQIIGAQVDIS